MNVAQYYIQFFLNHGIDYAFGVPGKAIMPVWQACLDSKLKLVLARHESGAAFMADGWSRGTLKPALVLTTLGPGVTNVITGVATAWADSIPMIIVTGQTEVINMGQGVFQDSSSIGRGTDVIGLMKPITKMSLEAKTWEEAIKFLKKGYNLTLKGRMGPIHISLPMDVQLQEVGDVIDFSEDLGKEKNMEMDNSQLQIDDILEESKKPIILVGWGSYLSKSGEYLQEFSDKYNIPIISTIKGKAVMAGNYKNYIGHIGAGSNEITKFFWSAYKADLVIVLGSRLGRLNYMPLADGLNGIKIVQVNIDPNEISPMVNVDRFICADVKQFLKVNLESKKVKVKGNQWCGVYKNVVEEIEKKKKNSSLSFDVIEVLNELMPSDTIYLPDAGNHWLLSLNRTKTNSSAAYFTGIGLASMGQAIGGAIGLKLAFPKRQIVCISGDGSMLMYGQEISTAVDLKTPIIFIIFNNASLGRILKAQKEDFNNQIGGVYIPRVDFVKWAVSMGAWASKIKNIKVFKKELKQSLKRKRPSVFEVDFPEIREIPL